jgi:protein TonB
VYQPFDQRSHQRAVTAVAVAVLHALAIWALVTGLAGRMTQVVVQRLDAVVIPLDKPSPRPTPSPTPTPAHSRHAAAAAPQGRKVPAAVVAPPVVIPTPQPIPAASMVGSGNAAAGAGSGAGGSGSGTGSGSGGTGTGAGDGGGVAVHARQTKGSLSRSDYPAELRKAGIGGAVSILVTIGPSGLVDACSVVRGSGVPQLDAMTCRLVQERYRFTPARNAAGNPTTDWVRETHIWWSGHKPVPDQVPPAPVSPP